jgi:hypothetical protein
VFGLKKLTTQIVENLKIITREKVKQTDILEAQNEQLEKIAYAAKRIDEFNRIIYAASTGYEIPEGEDAKKMLDFQNTQGGERDAVNEMYYSDMTVSAAPILNED